MTNTILNPIDALDPFVYVSGKEISNDADALVNLGKMQNYLHAHYGAGVMIEQKFDDHFRGSIGARYRGYCFCSF